MATESEAGGKLPPGVGILTRDVVNKRPDLSSMEGFTVRVPRSRSTSKRMTVPKGCGSKDPMMSWDSDNSTVDVSGERNGIIVGSADPHGVGDRDVSFHSQSLRPRRTPTFSLDRIRDWHVHVMYRRVSTRTLRWVAKAETAKHPSRPDCHS